jgi:hypothetical protein
MKQFFQKYPVELDELTAVKMIHRKIETAEQKCKKGDKSYLEDLAKAAQMTEDFFGELGLNTASFN